MDGCLKRRSFQIPATPTGETGQEPLRACAVLSDWCQESPEDGTVI